MDKTITPKSKIPVIRPTKSSTLLSNHNNNNRMSEENVRNSNTKIIEENSDTVKKVRRRWKSVVNSLCSSRSDLWWPSATVRTQNGDTSSNPGSALSREWREDFSDHSTIERHLQMAKDLVDGIDSNQLGDDEKNYRREQAIFWLMRAAERGSKQARKLIGEMAERGEGITEKNFKDVRDSLSPESPKMIGQQMGKRTFRKLDNHNRHYVNVGQMYRMAFYDTSVSDQLSSDEIRVRLSGFYEREISEKESSLAGESFANGDLPESSLNTQFNLYSCHYQNKSLFSPDYLLCKTISLVNPGFAIIMLLAIVNYSLLNVEPRMIFSIGLLCQSLFRLIFGPSMERQFNLWSSLWGNTCKLSENSLTELKELFLWKQNISNSLQCLVTITLLFLYPSVTDSPLTRKLLFASLFVTFLTVSRNLTRLQFILLFVILLPHAVPYAYRYFDNNQITAFMSKLSSVPQLDLLYFLPAAITGLVACFSMNSNFLSILYFSTFFHFVMKSQVHLWMIVMALGLLVSSIRKRSQVLRSLVVIGIVGLALMYEPILLKTNQMSQTVRPVTPMALTWQRFHQICPKNIDVTTRLFCSNFVGQNIAWEGRIGEINLEKRPPTLKSILLSALPERLKLIYRQISTHNAKPKTEETFCRSMHAEFKLPCDKWTSKNYQCKLTIEMSRSLFSTDGQKIAALLTDMEECQKVKVGSYIHFLAAIAETVQDTVVEIHSVKIL